MCNSAQWWVVYKGGELPGSQLWPLILLLGLHHMIVSINHTLYVFQAFSPPVACEVHGSDGSSSFIPQCQRECRDGYIFPTSSVDATIVTEWSLVCGRAALRPLMGTLYFVGVVVGALAGGAFADRWGRRTVMLGCLVGQTAVGVAVSQAPTLVAYACLRTLQGVFVQGLQGSTFMLMVELSPTRLRSAMAMVMEMNWSVGLGALSVLAYLLPRWRDLQLAVTLPAVLVVLWVRWIPESRLWLDSKGKTAPSQPLRRGVPGQGSYRAKHDETMENGVQTAVVCSDVGESATIIPEIKTPPPPPASVRDLVSANGLRLYSTVMMAIWFSVSMSYYGTTFYTPALTGDRFLNFGIGALMEMVAFALTFVVLSRIGRRLPLATFLATAATTCLAVSVVLAMKTSDGGVAVQVLVLTSKASLVASFYAIFLYTAELFPTSMRAVAMGLCSSCGRVGNMLAPQLLYLGSGGEQWLPLMVMGALLVLVAGFTLMLPETLGRELPATVEDAKMLRVRPRKIPRTPTPNFLPPDQRDPELQHLTDTSPPNDTPQHKVHGAETPQLNVEDFRGPSWKCDLPVMEDDSTDSSALLKPPTTTTIITSIYDPNQTAEELGRSLLESLNKTPEPKPSMELHGEAGSPDRKPYLETEFVHSPEVVASTVPAPEHKSTVTSSV